MSTSDKVLFNLFGYSYIRIGLDQRRYIKYGQLQAEFRSRIYALQRKYEGKVLDEKINKLLKWRDIVRSWIDKEMK